MIDLRQQTCCFSGHRSIPQKDLPLILNRTEQIVCQLIHQGILFFGLGGAIGYDTEVTKLLFLLRAKEYPQIKIILVYPFEGFSLGWNEKQQVEYSRLFSLYDKTVCVATHAFRGAYLARNRHLVDHSSHCICYCTRTTGGTAYTMRYAAMHGVIVKNVSPFPSGKMSP